MDKLTKYRNAVRQALTHFTKGTYLPPQHLKDVTLFDPVNDRYAVITQGWDKGEYVNELTAEVDIVDGKVLIQFNNTDIGIKQLLLENGVPESDIVIPALEKV
jgi:hypothetical protein